MARATGESARHSGFSIAAASTNTAVETATNRTTSRADRTPAGSSREAVRGLRASIARSTRRLKPIAALRAETMATTIQRTWRPLMPETRAASDAEARANGSAKTECEKRIIRP